MDVLYAPYERFSPAASHVLADWVFGGALLLFVAWAFMLAWNAWVHAVALRKEIWQARGLRPGVILLAGVAEAVEQERQAAEHDAFFAPFVELKIHQRGEQRHTKNGHYILWKELSRSLSERPFHLRTDAGTIVRVEPAGRIDLIDRLDPPQRTGNDRTRSARIVPGERIWVRGQLVALGSGSGPYRGDGQIGAALHTLRPARDRPLFISSEPVAAEERASARFHGLFGLGLLAALLVTQGQIFSAYQALRSRGVEGTATVERTATWVTHHKNSTTTHWGMHLGYFVDGLAYTKLVEVNRGAYWQQETGELGNSAPIVYDPKSPDTMQIGSRREVGLTTGHIIAASFFTGLPLLFWWLASYTRRPWWRQKKLNETQPGLL